MMRCSPTPLRLRFIEVSNKLKFLEVYVRAGIAHSDVIAVDVPISGACFASTSWNGKFLEDVLPPRLVGDLNPRLGSGM
jgi:hypothetical protein